MTGRTQSEFGILRVEDDPYKPVGYEFLVQWQEEADGSWVNCPALSGIKGDGYKARELVAAWNAIYLQHHGRAPYRLMRRWVGGWSEINVA